MQLPSTTSLWTRPRQPHFAAAAGIMLYLLQAAQGMARVADVISLGLHRGLSGAQAAEVHGALPLMRDFYSTRVAPARVARLAAAYTRAMWFTPWQVRLLAPRALSSRDLNMVAHPMLDLQAWLDGETPDPRRFAAARLSLSMLSGRMEDTLRLRRAKPSGHLVNYPYRTDQYQPVLEIEDFVGAGWSESISDAQARWIDWQPPKGTSSE